MKKNCRIILKNFKKSEPVRRKIGENVTLNCTRQSTLDKDDIVEWSTPSEEDFLFLRERGKNTNICKDGFCLAAPPGKDVFFSISNVHKTDEGSHCCCIKKPRSEVECINLTLTVLEDESSTTQDPHARKGNSTPDPTKTTPPNGQMMKNILVYIIVGVIFCLLIFLCIGIGIWKKKKSARRNSGPITVPESIPLNAPNEPRQRRTTPPASEEVV